MTKTSCTLAIRTGIVTLPHQALDHGLLNMLFGINPVGISHRIHSYFTEWPHCFAACREQTEFNMLTRELGLAAGLNALKTSLWFLESPVNSSAHQRHLSLTAPADYQTLHPLPSDAIYIEGLYGKSTNYFAFRGDFLVSMGSRQQQLHLASIG